MLAKETTMQKWCELACGWCATNDADGWQEGGCRNAPPFRQPDPPMKPQDPQAERITFGVELETTIPATSGIVVGGYNFGAAVRAGAANGNTQHLTAPTFDGAFWKAERDGSICANPGRVACEFVSLILTGGEGVEHLLQFVEWANAIGAIAGAKRGQGIGWRDWGGGPLRERRSGGAERRA